MKLKSFLTVAVMTLVAAGCHSNRGVAAKSNAVEGFTEVERDINTATIRLDSTMRSLDALENASDLKVAYRAYQSELAGLEDASGEVREGVSDLQSKMNTYLSQWDSTTPKLMSPELRDASQKRLDNARDNFESMLDEARSARDDFDPLMVDLRDINRYLSADLTKSGLNTVDNQMGRSRDQAEKVKSSLEDWKTQLIDLRQDLSATTTQPSGNMRK